MIVTETLVYEGAEGALEGVAFEGTVSWDDSFSDNRTGTRPVVMVTPTFKGQSAFETGKAELLAELGYVGFAIDIYGQGKRASTPEEAGKLMAVLDSDRALLLKHMQLALRTARQLPQTNISDSDEIKVAAIGFCFGGKCVLDLARSGADMCAAVSFHGIYDPPKLDEGVADLPVKSAVLVLHGWEDPLAPREDMVALADELTRNGADWQIHAYGQTAHAFTNPMAQAKADGMYFVEKSAQRGWQTMRIFLEEQFS